MKNNLEKTMSDQNINNNYYNLGDKHPVDISRLNRLSSSSFDFDQKNPYTLNDVFFNCFFIELLFLLDSEQSGRF